MRPCILFTRLAARVAIGLSLTLAACSNEPTVVSTPDRPTGPLLAIGTDPVSGATLETNKDDYMPGEVVHLTGHGWAANETIALFMTEEPNTHDDVTSQVVADSTGAFSMHFYDVQEHDMGVTFTLTATGQVSGSKATVTFTDGIFQIAILTSPAGLAPSIDYIIRNGCAVSTGASPGTYTGTRIPVNATKVLVFRIPSPSGYTFQNTTAPGLTVTSIAPDSLCVAGGSPTGPDQNKDVTLNYSLSNAAPVLTAIGNQSTVEGTALSFTATATDDGLPAPPTLTFTLETPGAACLLLHPQVPAGATITGAGLFSWTPAESEGPGTYCARVQVSDGALTDFEDFEISVTEGNAAPVLDAIGNQSVDELDLLSITLGATDSDLPANTLTFSLGTPDAGCGFPIAAGAAVTAGVFTWTPTEAQGPGTYCARVVVSDGTDTDHEDFQIAVAEVNVAPVLDPIGSLQVNELAFLGFTASGSDADIPANTKTFSLGTPDVACGHPIAAGAAITGGGDFSWTPTEAQGPGVYCARVVLSDGALTDFEDFVITVHEVNVAPVLTVPADFSVAWGVAISGKQASATDADIPANTLTFSLVGEPAGMTINSSSGLISWTPTSAQVGAHVITVRVTDDGAGFLFDETPTFTITVTAHGTTLTYDGSLSGQYSDQANLSATLTDNVTNTPVSGKLVRFTFGGSNVGTFTTNGSGVASTLYTVPTPDGNNTVTANFNGDAQYLGASDTETFDVDAENADVIPDINNSSAFQVPAPGSPTGSVTLKFDVKEDVTPAPEPDVNDGALAGNINNATLGVTLIPVAGGASPTLTCAAPAAAAGYTTRTFTCINPAVPLGAYEVATVIGAGGSPSGAYYAGRDDDALTVYDPSLGFVTGGGKFILDGDRVSFGMVVNYTGKGKTTARGNLVVVRHHADGSTCRAKSNAIDAPAITNYATYGLATFTGKANYACVDALGVTLPGGAGNLTLTGYVEDNGEPGSSAATSPDKFWVKVFGELMMTTPATSTTAKTLTGGNIQVPKVK
ncbi:MAG TPA: putative Ig domain-containing protein [Gemmatimonadales bacterium]|nr:putative Ig domain-containing protein [Gemmatimonadales bacterium]